ncbi:MAG TPA: aspartate aminotransferase family protein [Pseudogracilibacillus sp.]|nr:aspartate aminotransferase family protein [Pseudogracilibacillus sp.]
MLTKDVLTSYNKDGSEKLFEEALNVIPGGVTANIKHFEPYPIFMKEGHGSKLIDEDNQTYVDYSLCYGALITGHGHERIMQRTQKQLEDSGTIIFGTPHSLEATMAKRIIDLYQGIEQIRFTNSGTEAVLLAIRLAVAHTKKEKIAKFEGHYHGGLNNLLASINPSEQDAGEADYPNVVFESNGIPDDERDNTIILPFNNLEATSEILREHAEDLAAVILEPVQGGFIPADEEFLHGLRKITEELNIVLIFDEVKTGFRVALGGAQSAYNINPDLTTLGKVLGGGLPIGAVGGRKDIMMLSAASKNGDVFSVGSKSNETVGTVFHSGTYNGHPLIMAVGLETIDILEEDNMMENLFSQTMLLRNRLEKMYASYNINMQTIGMGSIFNIIFTDQPIKSYRDMWKANIELRQEIDTELLSLGVYLKPLNRYSMSTVHSTEDIDFTVKAHESALNKVLRRHTIRKKRA